MADTLILPVNTDGTDAVDYLDTDSDNEGGNDTAEAGLTGTAAGLSTDATDADGDGLFDVFETQGGTNANDGFNVNESLATGAASLPDTDGDLALATPLEHDVDFRDAQIDVDTDGDGIFNVIDVDDDNDGILDTVESSFDFQDVIADTVIAGAASATGTLEISGQSTIVTVTPSNGAGLAGTNNSLSGAFAYQEGDTCLLYTSPSPRDQRGSRMPSSA